MTTIDVKEKLIMEVRLPILPHFGTISTFVSVGYRKTGNKFWIVFNGSKGYLSNIEIRCEGYQKEDNNIIWLGSSNSDSNKNGALLNKMVSIFHSDENGVRVSISENEIMCNAKKGSY